MDELNTGDTVVSELSEVAGGEASLLSRQRDAAHALLRGEDDVRERLCIGESEWLGWIRGGEFTGYVSSLAWGLAEVNVPSVWRTLYGLVNDGSVPAIRLYFDLLSKRSGAAHEAEHRTVGGELAGLRESIFAEGATE